MVKPESGFEESVLPSQLLLSSSGFWIGSPGGLCPSLVGLCTDFGWVVLGLHCNRSNCSTQLWSNASTYIWSGIAARRVLRTSDQLKGHQCSVRPLLAVDKWWLLRFILVWWFYWFPTVVFISISIFPKEVGWLFMFLDCSVSSIKCLVLFYVSLWSCLFSASGW